jgi:hypothetical protein
VQGDTGGAARSFLYVCVCVYVCVVCTERMAAHRLRESPPVWRECGEVGRRMRGPYDDEEGGGGGEGEKEDESFE